MDEPTNHLEVQHQLDLPDDLNLAAAFCDGSWCCRGARSWRPGPPVEVRAAALIERVGNVRADVDVAHGVASIRFPRRPRAEGAGVP